MAQPVSENLYETMLRVENKDIFVDLKRNKNGVYLKISERRNGGGRNTVLIPVSGIQKLKGVIDEVSKVSYDNSVSKERKSRVAADPEVAARSVYVTGLAWETEDEELAEYFSQAGPVTKATVLRKYRKGNPRSSMGCGIVEFKSPESALNAIKTLNETELAGRKIRCREDRILPQSDEDEKEPEETESAPKARRGKRAEKPVTATEDREVDPFKVFVSSLAWEVTPDDLSAAFAEVGEVVSAEVLITKKGRSMGSGIVEFGSEADAERALTSMNGVEIKGRAISLRPCYVPNK